jgi:hypothetical protein
MRISGQNQAINHLLYSLLTILLLEASLNLQIFGIIDTTIEGKRDEFGMKRITATEKEELLLLRKGQMTKM